MTNKKWIPWLVGALALFVFLFLIRSVLLPFVLGIITAYFLDPAADRLERYKLSRTSATGLITGAFFLTLIVLGVIIVPIVAEQLVGLMVALPEYINTLDAKYEPEIAKWLGGLPTGQIEGLKSAALNLSGTLLKFVGDFAAGIFASGMAAVNLLSLMLITPLVAFYLLRDWDEVTQQFDSLLPRKHANIIREQLSEIDATLAGFIRGQMNVCMILAIFYGLGLSLVGLKFGLIIGMATGFLVIFPYIGLMFGMATGLMVAFFQFDNMTQVGLVLGVFVLGQIVEGYFLTPKLVGEKVGLHPVWIIFALLAGGALFGLLGVLIAVPVAAVIGVLIRFALSRYLQSAYYHG